MPTEKPLNVRAYRLPPLDSVPLPAPTWELEDFDLEIGSGTGLHSLGYCLAHLDRNLVSIERTAEKFGKFKKRAEKYGEIPNLFFLRADAQWWVAKHAPPSSIRTVFILYPNPYPKLSQANHRWHRSPFMGLLLRALKPGGRLILATNIESYFRESLEYLGAYWGLELSSRNILPGAPGRTHFEKKYLLSGQQCFEVTATKPEDWQSPVDEEQ